MDAKKIYIGSWFQRTTLHLSEIYDFLIDADSPLDLDKEKLRDLRDNLDLSNVEDIVGDFEHIYATTNSGITIKIYEDGLITLGRDPKGDIADDIDFYMHHVTPIKEDSAQCLEKNVMHTVYWHC